MAKTNVKKAIQDFEKNKVKKNSPSSKFPKSEKSRKKMSSVPTINFMSILTEVRFQVYIALILALTVIAFRVLGGLISTSHMLVLTVIGLFVLSFVFLAINKNRLKSFKQKKKFIFYDYIKVSFAYIIMIVLYIVATMVLTKVINEPSFRDLTINPELANSSINKSL